MNAIEKANAEFLACLNEHPDHEYPRPIIAIAAEAHHLYAAALDESECTLDDEEAAHRDTLRMLAAAQARIAELEQVIAQERQQGEVLRARVADLQERLAAPRMTSVASSTVNLNPEAKA